VEAIQRSGKQISQNIANYSNGRDEMNLVEFPLALLSERAPAGVLTHEHSDEIEERGVVIQRHVSVAATEKFGLPTAKDEDVLMGMLQLAKLQNEFTSPIVCFTRLQLIKLLGWDNTRWSYERIALALERWRSVTITYRKAWRDNKDREWQDRGGFGLIDSYNLRDSRRASRRGEGSEPPTESLSWFRWNGHLFDSFRSGYLKKLDYKIYRDLEQQAAKRLYRYLDKHFFEPHRLRLDFDLQTLAFEHLGMSRNYDNTQIRRALQPAIEELEQIGFIEEAPCEKRYRKLNRGRWRVSFSKKVEGRPARKEAPKAPVIPNELTGALRRREKTEGAERRKVEAYLAAQTEERRSGIEREALLCAAPFLRQNYESGKLVGGPLFEECRRLIIHQHVLRLLSSTGPQAPGRES
jgi:hypothetical protein